MKSIKIHPTVVFDESGIKFLFNHDGSHFTMRFSGHPLLIMEEWYFLLGGKADKFHDLYYKIKSGEEVEEKDLEIMKEVIQKSNEFFKVMERIGKRKLSPFTIYAQPFDVFKYGKK